MGLQRDVRFPTGSEPDWPTVARRVADGGEPCVLRMIDGLPAFPDEQPPDGWQELRASFGDGMVTVRRQPGLWSVVVWGNADAALLGARDALADAITSAGQGGAVSTDPR